MLLDKWYGDFLSGGEATILYRANLRIGLATIGFAGKIVGCSGDAFAFRVGLIELPRIEGDRLMWPGDAGPLAWAGPEPRSFELWPQAGRVRWKPVVLNGAVTGEGVGPGATGYAEHLRLALAPWALGLSILRWGRFCGGRHSLVWIEWVGDSPLRLALLDGKPQALEEASAEGVALAAGGRLRLGARRTLVEGPIGSGALARMPWPRRIRPLRFLEGVERKWVAEGGWFVNEYQTDCGHVIAEEVRWP